MYCKFEMYPLTHMYSFTEIEENPVQLNGQDRSFFCMLLNVPQLSSVHPAHNRPAFCEELLGRHCIGDKIPRFFHSVTVQISTPPPISNHSPSNPSSPSITSDPNPQNSPYIIPIHHHFSTKPHLILYPRYRRISTFRCNKPLHMPKTPLTLLNPQSCCHPHFHTATSDAWYTLTIRTTRLLRFS